ncbi:hypothetical protein [Mesorhizobium sp. ORS 3428]|uniref:hypothetical protein n=1 Tax=Mesorhizobium sp. ORS 3428 TaxID=540997 RepID=UPI0012FF7562|nr:hypothetical protein [Mesorhizobium sp. ORS 3428]
MAVMLFSCLHSTWCNRKANASPPQCAADQCFRGIAAVVPGREGGYAALPRPYKERI